MGVGDGELGREGAAVAPANRDAPAKGAVRRVGVVVAARPPGVLDGADAAPQREGRGAVRALAGVAALVMPGAVLERDGDDVGQRVLERLARRVGVVFLRIA